MTPAEEAVAGYSAGRNTVKHSDALTFRLAGLDFELRSNASAAPPSLLPTYQPFLTTAPAERAGVYTLAAPGQHDLLHADAARLTWECESWRMGPTSDGRLAIEIHNVPRDRWIIVANVAPDFSSGIICPTSRSIDRLSPHSLNYPYDQIILFHRLLYFDAAILHASGVAVENQGLVFCGHSGAGKTTIARLWRAHGGVLMNDERVLVRVVGSDVRLASTPWHGSSEHEINALNVPLRAICHLRQSKENRLTPIHGTERITRLLTTAISPLYTRDAIERVLSMWERVTDAVPSYELEFTPDRRPLALCREQLLS